MATDLRTSELKEPVDVAEYLFRRLREVGVRSIHGLPGDYNLVALDYISKNGLKWVGNANELNAGYAADGYARVKGISALVTTFGVGELSAVNAIAGAYSEYVPVVHIVGYPSTISQRNGMLLHHTLGNGDFRVFSNISREISCAVAMLNDAHEAATLIDDAIRKCYLLSRPVYISLPTDIVQKKVEGERLKTPIDLNFPPNDAEKEDYVVSVVLKYLQSAKNPVILVDACAIRHRALNEVHKLVEKSGIPTFVAPMGKGAINETLPNYGGVYAGDGSNTGVRERVESADLVLSIGAIKSDFNTAGFTYQVSQLNTIDFHSSYVRVKYSEYPGVRMNGVLRKVTAQMGQLSIQAGPTPNNEIPQEELLSPEPTITQAWFWPRLGQWLQPEDIVITETGTANFGSWETRFPRDVTAISQVLWGSIGYATGSCQGAALAAKDLAAEAGADQVPRRTILFTGDGSFQLTAQEVGTMLRNGLNPIIFVICNEGYTIERYIHGWDADYNDVQPWDYKAVPAALGGRPDQLATYVVKSRQQTEELFMDREFVDPKCKKLRFVEIYMDRDDAPKVLKMTAEAAARTNAKLE
ncbi:thiamine diphosphate-binding protein [Lineolata rhizophorae]|uniref:Pyruvate decarboxylase n=1 Tax=Lineolata rhizophorae TaxID=578093 RepID=A0A6A6P5L1_9PEZI|nr:thiamine diphosphate-binding protein [Lineolata rhizophorae]